MMWRRVFGNLTRWCEDFQLVCQGILKSGYRSVLTVLMMVTGIAALVGIAAATEALSVSVRQEYTRLGAHTFYLQSGRRQPEISVAQVRLFCQGFSFPGEMAASWVRDGCMVRGNGRSTPPNMSLIYTDEGFVGLQGAELVSGRNFSQGEVSGRLSVAMIGSQVRERLFPGEDPLGAWIQLDRQRFRIIGVLGKSKGVEDLDRSVLVPITLSGGQLAAVSCVIGFRPWGEMDTPAREDWISRVRVRFRTIRHLGVSDPDDFVMQRNDLLMIQLDESLGVISKGAYLIAALALLGASAGLMNLMLIAVKERVREIGVRMALGAAPGQIRWQFLMEAWCLCLIGGAGGLLSGLLAGWRISCYFGVGFQVPWRWILLVFAVCSGIALLSGTLPAKRAAALDPMEALRVE